MTDTEADATDKDIAKREMSSYKMRPSLAETFKCSKIKEIIQETMVAKLNVCGYGKTTFKMSSPASKSPEQSDKSKKYDRQLRLWGDHGQSLLEGATVCLANATAVGCEVLKGLVLSGIGGFTIADNSVVNENDLGINFFLDTSCIGQPKASSCMQLLLELNPDVRGDFVDESVDYILANRPTFFDTFAVVVASNLSEHTLLALSDCLWKAKIPFLYCRSLGFFGSIRLQINEHCVVETHPDNPQIDLRLDHPFPALQKHLESSEVTHKVPWLLVLNKYLQVWKANNNGRIPQTYKEKCELREMIGDAMTGDEENYAEAIKAVNTAFGGGKVSSTVNSIFNYGDHSKLTKQSDSFWIMVKALEDFMLNENNGHLPLSGILPDMTADSESYIKLQNIYRNKALQDANKVYQKCQAYMVELGVPEDTISERMVRLFCREADTISVHRGSRISDEYKKNTHLLSTVDYSEIQGSLTEIYIALRAYERFLTEYGSVPGECYVENDISRLKVAAAKMLSDWGVHITVSDDIIHEICRYGGSEVHSVSAFVGGCVVQEVVKIITKQYKPIDNTFLYNAITSETTTMKL